MKPREYLDYLLSEIRFDQRDEYDRLIHSLDALYQVGAIDDSDFMYFFFEIKEAFKFFDIPKDGVIDMFISVPEILTT